MMKKVIFVSAFILFFGLAPLEIRFLTGLAPHALAQNFVPLAPIPGLTTGDVANQPGLAIFFNNLYKYLIGLAAILAIIEIIWGGLEIAVNKDSVSKVTDAKGKIYNAIFGLILVLAPALIFSIINPSILNLGVNLEPLDTRPSSGVATGQPARPEAASSIPGCNKVRGAYFQSIDCTSREGRDKWAQNCTSGTVKTVDPAQQGPGALYMATCTTTSGPFTGPYLFAQTSSIPTLKNYKPAANAPGNPNNGNDVVRFAQQCNSDGGVFCVQNIAFVPTSCGTLKTQSSDCYSLHISCQDPATSKNASIPIIGGLSFNGCQVGTELPEIIQ